MSPRALVGYSMGADVAARTASCSSIVQALVLGGVGGSLADPVDLDPEGVAATLRQVAPVPFPAPGAELRELADVLGADKLAAAALTEGLGRQGSPDFSAVRCPVLVIAGADDDMTGGRPESLADCYVRGRSIVLPGLDHLTAVFAPEFTAAVMAFLGEAYPPARRAGTG